MCPAEESTFADTNVLTRVDIYSHFKTLYFSQTNNGGEPIITDFEPIIENNESIKDLISGDSLSIYRFIKAQPTLSKP